MSDENQLEMEARLKDFVSNNLATIQQNIERFAKEGQSNFKKLEEQTKGNTVSFKQLMGAATAFFGATQLISFLKDSAHAAAEASQGQAKLESVLRSTHHAAGMTIEALNEMAASYQELTTFEDDAVTGAQHILLTFTRIGKDVFPEATETVLNMSAALGQDLKSSAIQLGKALNDPIAGVTALRRVGVSLSEEQEKQIKNMVEQNKLVEAQRIVLNELATEFGGLAKQMADTPEGKIRQTINTFDDFKEIVGAVVIELGGALSGPAKSFFKMLQEEATKALTIIRPAMEGVIQAFNSFDNTTAQSSESLFTFQDIVFQVTKYVNIFALGLRVTWEILQSLGQAIGTFVSNYMLAFIEQWNKATIVVQGFGKILKAVFERDFASIPGIIEEQKKAIELNHQTIVEAIAQNSTTLKKEIKENLDDAVRAYQNFDNTVNRMKGGNVAAAPNIAGLPPEASGNPTLVGDTEAQKKAYEEKIKLAKLYVEQFQEVTTQLNQARAEGKITDDEQEKAALQVKQENEMLALGENYTAKLILAKAHEQELSNLEKEQSERRKKVAEQEASAKIRLEQQVVTAKFQLAQTVIGIGQTLDENNKMLFYASRGIAAAQAIVAGLLASAQALAFPPGPPATIPLAATIKAAGYANAALIGATAIKGYEDGGIIPGRNTLIRTNENGIESVLNAQATRMLGTSGVDALNSGANPFNRPTVNIRIEGSSYQVSGSASREDVALLEDMDKRNRMRLLAELKAHLEEIKDYRI